MLKILALLAVVGLVSCVASTDSRGIEGELAGLTPEQAAERVGIAIEDLNDCQKECIAYSIAGCADIRGQCNDDDPNDFAFAGAYATSCTDAQALACGGVVELHKCCTHCSSWFEKALDSL